MSGPRFPGDAGRYIPYALRQMIMDRSERVCFYCGNGANTIDHVVPWVQGGTHHPLNLVACCSSCNSIAGDRLFRDVSDKIDYILQRRKTLSDLGYDVQALGDYADFPWEVDMR
jgi:hypothetical protein